VKNITKACFAPLPVNKALLYLPFALQSKGARQRENNQTLFSSEHTTSLYARFFFIALLIF